MGTVRESIDIAVPVRVAYQLLCHFEDYPHFRAGVQQVTQLSRTKAHWVMQLGGTQTEFDSAITERRPDELLAWHSIEGPRLGETVTFQRLTDTTTRITTERNADTQHETDERHRPDEARLPDLFNQTLRDDLCDLKEYMENGTRRSPEPAAASRTIVP